VTASSSGESRANLPPRGFGPLHHLHTRGFRALSVRSQTTAHPGAGTPIPTTDPQGLAVDDGAIYVSAYRSDSLGVRRDITYR
jgi:hypothetical protein